MQLAVELVFGITPTICTYICEQIQNSVSMELRFLEMQFLSVSICENTSSVSHPLIFVQLLKCNTITL